MEKTEKELWFVRNESEDELDFEGKPENIILGVFGDRLSAIRYAHECIDGMTKSNIYYPKYGFWGRMDGEEPCGFRAEPSEASKYDGKYVINITVKAEEVFTNL